MQVPAGLMSVVLWLATGMVCAAAVWLLYALVREWRQGKLW